jgi:hypothetical protein
MTLTADDKGRLACRELFPPHSSFEATREQDGKVTLVRLQDEGKLQIVKPVLRDGFLVLPLNEGDLDVEALSREIRADREKENARLLG